MTRVGVPVLTFPARAFERGQVDFNGLFPPEIMTFESNIAYTLRFMIDTKVSQLRSLGLGISDISGGGYELGRVQRRKVRSTRGKCQKVIVPNRVYRTVSLRLSPGRAKY